MDFIYRSVSEQFVSPSYPAQRRHSLGFHSRTRQAEETRTSQSRYIFSTQPPVSTPKKLPPPESRTHARLPSLGEPSSAARACVPPAHGSPVDKRNRPAKLGSGRGRSRVCYSRRPWQNSCTGISASTIPCLSNTILSKS
ncbi:TPA: hypothetical protein BOS_11412 [Bos taurus]|nr:TPA: hypothetical protein BOS_11412 [Bos taurus]